jgi:hypothetical protein
MTCSRCTTATSASTCLHRLKIAMAAAIQLRNCDLVVCIGGPEFLGAVAVLGPSLLASVQGPSAPRHFSPIAASWPSSFRTSNTVLLSEISLASVALGQQAGCRLAACGTRTVEAQGVFSPLANLKSLAWRCTVSISWRIGVVKVCSSWRLIWPSRQRCHCSNNCFSNSNSRCPTWALTPERSAPDCCRLHCRLARRSHPGGPLFPGGWHRWPPLSGAAADLLRPQSAVRAGCEVPRHRLPVVLLQAGGGGVRPSWATHSDAPEADGDSRQTPL